MKKFILSFGVVAAFVFYVIQEKGAQSKRMSAPNPVLQTPGTPPAATGQYKDGEFTGPVTDAFFGPFQVKAVIKNGRIADIEFLQYPNDRRNSIQINTQAMPIMKQEAIASQSAKVDIVTGATQSSEAFQKSLASALAQAKN